jgi:heme/copper-type cytochrome/quinol oxidase subunit 1
MALLLPFVAALAVVALLGPGRLARLAALQVRHLWLAYAALALQVVAFPFDVLPWSTPEQAASALWLASYAPLVALAAANIRLAGVPVLALGMALNLAAVVANGGQMPVTTAAMRAAGLEYAVEHNSVAAPDPALAWLVDRWAAPDWVPLANVYSVGDVLIAAGVILIVLCAAYSKASGTSTRLTCEPSLAESSNTISAPRGSLAGALHPRRGYFAAHRSRH